MVSVPIDGYDDLTVDGVKEAVHEEGLDDDAEALLSLLQYEEETKDRVTVTRFLEDRFDELVEQRLDEAEAEADAAVEELEAVEENLSETAGSFDEEPDYGSGFDEPEDIYVTPTGDHEGYIAGHWFDEPEQVVETKRDSRVEAALDDGLLEEVFPRSR